MQLIRERPLLQANDVFKLSMVVTPDELKLEFSLHLGKQHNDPGLFDPIRTCDTLWMASLIAVDEQQKVALLVYILYVAHLCGVTFICIFFRKSRQRFHKMRHCANACWKWQKQLPSTPHLFTVRCMASESLQPMPVILPRSFATVSDEYLKGYHGHKSISGTQQRF